MRNILQRDREVLDEIFVPDRAATSHDKIISGLVAAQKSLSSIMRLTNRVPRNTFKKRDTSKVSDRRKGGADRRILANGETHLFARGDEITGDGKQVEKESTFQAIGRYARQVERVNADIRPSLWRAASH